MIEFEQNTSNKDYFKAIKIHYFAYKSTMINPILGILLLAVIIYKTIQEQAIGYLTIAFFLWSVFLIVRPFFSIYSTYSKNKKANPNSLPTKIKMVDDNKLIVETAGKSTEFNFLELFGYRDKGKFLFIYITQIDFLVIDKQQLPENKLSSITAFLKNTGISKIK